MCGILAKRLDSHTIGDPRNLLAKRAERELKQQQHQQATKLDTGLTNNLDDF
jgi:hypothetical protein